MRIPGRSGDHIPGGARQGGVLWVSLQRTVHGILPEGTDPIEGGLLDSPVVGVGGTRSAKPDDFPGIRSVGSVGEEVLPEIIRAVVNGERAFRGRSPLQTRRAGAGVHHGETDVVASEGWPDN